MTPRAAATLQVHAVCELGKALDTAQQLPQLSALSPRDRAYASALSHAALRHGRAYREALAPFMQRAPQAKLLALLMVGCADLHSLGTAPHAAVGEAVNAARALGLRGAAGMVNALLRRFARESASLLAAAGARDASAQHGLPAWLLQQLQQAYPQNWAEIAAQSLRQAPMWLRVHPKSGSAADYARNAALSASTHPHLPQALCLEEPVPVTQLPGFAQGSCSVQDVAAQLAALLLNPRDGERVLDACAAPGGKTAHLLELAPQAQVLAVDRDAKRTPLIMENLTRLGARAEVRCLDAASEAWPERDFDAILLDAPCSATGVIRRHPDIAWLRRESDIPALVREQARLLNALIPRLRPGGRLLYATCSVLPSENSEQIGALLARQAQLRELPLPDWFGQAAPYGRQQLPGQAGSDGFYYCLLQRAD